MRSRMDAVMVGVDTVISDNPQLTVRHVRGKNPLRVIVDTRLRTPKSVNILNAELSSGTIIATTESDPRVHLRYTRKGATIVVCDDYSPQKEEIRFAVAEFRKQAFFKLRYFDNEANLGFDGNLRRLIELAVGKFIMFMGDDDLFKTENVAPFIAFLKLNKECAYVLKTHLYIHGDGSVERQGNHMRTDWPEAQAATVPKGPPHQPGRAGSGGIGRLPA